MKDISVDKEKIVSRFSESARRMTFLKIKSRDSLGNLKHFDGVPYIIIFLKRKILS